MTDKTKLALINFTERVAEAIARNECGKDVDWRGVVKAQEDFAEAIKHEPDEDDSYYATLPADDV